MSRSGGLLRALTALGVGLSFLIGMPAALVIVFGWPLPEEVPDVEALSAWLAEPLNPDVLGDVAACVLWVLWAGFVIAVVVEIASLVRRVRVPAVPVGPLQGVAAGLVGAVGVAFAGTAAHAASATTVVESVLAPAPVDVAHPDLAPDQAPLLPSVEGFVMIDGCAHPYTVRPGDSLWHIAEQCLGGGQRWPEIWALNQNQSWPDVSGEASFSDPDLIYPQWTLLLPDDAIPPVPPSPDPSETIPADSDAADDEPTTPTAATGTSSVNPAAAETPTTLPTATVSTSATRNGTAKPGTDGIDLPGGSWIPWTLAAALTSVTALLWRQRRRRYVARPIEQSRPEPSALPPVLAQLQAAHHPVQPSGPDATPVAPVVGAAGFTGPGADSAARAALIAALAPDQTQDDEARARVVIAAATALRLLGPDADGFSSWERMHIAADLDEALVALEQRLLYTARRRDEHDYDGGPGSPAPLLLIAEPPANTARLASIVNLGRDTAVTAVVLGEWDTNTLHVDMDGTTTPTVQGEDRMGVLDAATAVQLLHTLREADTGEAGPNADEVTVIDLSGSVSTTPTVSSAPTTVTPVARGKAQVRVLGQPDVVDRPLAIPMRGYATEIMVYLAVHSDGASTEQILDDLWPAERRHITANRLYTGMSNLRKILAASSGDDQATHIDKRHGRYRLNPEAVDVDLWRLRAAHTAARAAGQDTASLTAALHEACDAARGQLAAGETYEWIEAHRYGTLRLELDVHAALAAAVQQNAPDEAARVLAAACDLDPLNESACRAAMHANHDLGYDDVVQTLWTRLTRALADIGETPLPETAALARDLGIRVPRQRNPQEAPALRRTQALRAPSGTT